MLIKRENVVNAAHLFPTTYPKMVKYMNNSSKKFFAFNGYVFDKEKCHGKTDFIDYSRAICQIEDTDGDGFEYTINTIIISGFPGVGKSQFVKDHKEFIVLDSDSSNFSWIKDGNGKNTKERNPEFPQCYIDHIKENIGKADIILVSSHDVVRKALQDNNINYYLVFPKSSKESMIEYMNRYIKRGNDYKFIKLVESQWNNWLTSIMMETFPFLIRLNEGEYLNDLFGDIPICKEYHELCSVKDTNADEYPTICHNCNCQNGYAKLKLI